MSVFENPDEFVMKIGTVSNFNRSNETFQKKPYHKYTYVSTINSEICAKYDDEQMIVKDWKDRKVEDIKELVAILENDYNFINMTLTTCADIKTYPSNNVNVRIYHKHIVAFKEEYTLLLQQNRFIAEILNGLIALKEKIDK